MGWTMPCTIGEVDKLFASGAESVTLTHAEWEAIQTNFASP